jgi:hypothetical protein
MKAVVKQKEETRNFIPAGTSDALARVYRLPIQILSEYRLDLLNEEVADYYRDQLRKMPIYINYDVGPRKN